MEFRDAQLNQNSEAAEAADFMASYHQAILRRLKKLGYRVTSLRTDEPAAVMAKRDDQTHVVHAENITIAYQYLLLSCKGE